MLGLNTGRFSRLARNRESRDRICFPAESRSKTTGGRRKAADMWGPIVGQRRRGRGGSVRSWAKVASWVVLGQQAESAGEFFFFFSFLYSISFQSIF